MECENCYIFSSPKNDDLVYLKIEEVRTYLNEIEREKIPTEEIGITGGEPFMNPDIIAIIEESLERGHKVLCLTNAMRPMMKCKDALLRLNKTYSDKFTLRVSVDHFKQEMHEEERGPRSWKPMILGLKWLSSNNFHIDIAGRTRWGENEKELREGFATLFKKENVNINAFDKKHLILFPEMDEGAAVPEITTDCWNILDINPDDIMCATSRMVVKRKGDEKPSVQACTLLAYEQEFNMGETLKEASQNVHLNHPHCAKFCVLGGGACSINEE